MGVRVPLCSKYHVNQKQTFLEFQHIGTPSGYQIHLNPTSMLKGRERHLFSRDFECSHRTAECHQRELLCGIQLTGSLAEVQRGK